MISIIMTMISILISIIISIIISICAKEGFPRQRETGTKRGLPGRFESSSEHFSGDWSFYL